jgi:predicted RNA-binding protein YlqC (UPF0109 family)
MKALLTYILKSIVEKPTEVKVSEAKEEAGIILFKIRVNPEDKKIIIGKGGKTINAIRNLLRIKAIKDQKRVSLELEE